MVFSLDRWVGKVAVVTGASSGIGAAIVIRLLEENITVVGIARRKEKIQQLSTSKNLYAMKVDITNEEELVQGLKWITENLGPIHILINSAGIARSTTYLDGDVKMWRDLIETHYIGLCVATRESIINMRKNNVDGHIIHINDSAGLKMYPIDNLHVCFASKYPVTAAVEGLRVELNSIGSKIKVSSISPGYVKTEIFHSALAVQPEMSDTLDVFEEAVSLESEDIADSVMYLLSTPPHVQVHNITILPTGQTL